MKDEGKEIGAGATSSTHQIDEALHATSDRKPKTIWPYPWRTHSPDGQVHSLNLTETRPGSGTTNYLFSTATELWWGIYLAPHTLANLSTAVPTQHLNTPYRPTIIPYQGQVVGVQGGFQSKLVLTMQIQTSVLDSNLDIWLLHF